jgi:hypothetical protein
VQRLVGDRNSIRSGRAPVSTAVMVADGKAALTDVELFGTKVHGESVPCSRIPVGSLTEVFGPLWLARGHRQRTGLLGEPAGGDGMKSIDIEVTKDGHIVLNIILAREGVFITTMLTEQELKELLSASQAIIDQLEAMRQTKEQEAKVQDNIDRSGPYSNPID